MLAARQLVAEVSGIRTLSVATVAASGAPQISAVDGHFVHGAWVFGTVRSAAKTTHLRTRPSASASHVRGEQLGVSTHGTVEVLNHADGTTDSHWPTVLEHLEGIYGESPLNWGDVVFYRLRPHWMVGYYNLPQAAEPESATMT